MSLRYAIKFKSEQFDFQSELPEEYNAGNRFYGKDLAEYLTNSFLASGLVADFLDEDWGWLVLGLIGEDLHFDVAIYNLLDDSEQPSNEWGLWVHAYGKGKILGFIPKRVEIAVPQFVVDVINMAIKSVAYDIGDWDD